ncbi:unnamed protein product, partial [Ectocarpus fasciculatus]
MLLLGHRSKREEQRTILHCLQPRTLENMLLQTSSLELFLKIGDSRFFQSILDAIDHVRRVEDRACSQHDLPAIVRTARPPEHDGGRAAKEGGEEMGGGRGEYKVGVVDAHLSGGGEGG